MCNVIPMNNTTVTKRFNKTLKTFSALSALAFTSVLLAGCSAEETPAADLPSYSLMHLESQKRGDWKFSYLDSDKTEQVMICESTRPVKRVRSSCISEDEKVKIEFSARRKFVRTVEMEVNGEKVDLSRVNADFGDRTDVRHTWVPIATQ